jgi:hypothetical protein
MGPVARSFFFSPAIFFLPSYLTCFRFQLDFPRRCSKVYQEKKKKRKSKSHGDEREYRKLAPFHPLPTYPRNETRRKNERKGKGQRGSASIVYLIKMVS